MSILIFDALLLAVPILLGILGLGRGGVREAVTLIGVLAGALLGALWSEPWGAKLAQNMAQSQRLMEAVVFDMLFVSTAILIGYGGALLLPPRQQLLGPPRSRLAGGLLGSLNGLLLVGLLLWSANQAGSRGLHDIVVRTRLGTLVSHRLPQLLLALAIVVVVLIILALIGRFLGLVKRAKKPATPQQPSRPRTSGPTVPGATRPQSSRPGSPTSSWPAPVQGSLGRRLEASEDPRRVKEEGHQGAFRPPSDFR